MAPAQGLKKAIRMYLMEGGKRVSAGCCGSCRTWFFPVQPALLTIESHRLPNHQEADSSGPKKPRVKNTTPEGKGD